MESHKTGTLQAADGTTLFWRHWPAAAMAGAGQAAEPRRAAPIVLSHGGWEESAHYAHVAEFFASHGIPVWAMDHRGHGRSGGQPMFIRRFEEYLDDLGGFISLVTREAGGRPVLIGHSMGGLIALRYALDRQDTLRALAVTGPWLRTRVPIAPALRLAVPVLSLVMPNMVIRQNPLPGAARYGEGVIKRDPENPQPTIATPRWFHQCLRAQGELFRRAGEFRLPLLIMQGAEDQHVSRDAARELYGLAGSPDKTFKLYEGRLHELFNDIGYQEVLQDTLAWLKGRALAPER